MTQRWLITLSVMLGSHSVLAQDEAEEGDVGYDMTDEVQSEAPAEEETPAEQGAPGWQEPQILLVGTNRVEDSAIRAVADILDETGDIVLGDDYVRDARAAGLPPESQSAFQELLPRFAVQIAVVLEPGGADMLEVTYREGQSGFILLQERHPIAFGNIDAKTEERIKAESRLALAVATRPSSPIMPQTVEEEEVEPGAVFELDVGLSIGMGTRSVTVPIPSIDQITVPNAVFMAAGLHTELGVRPRPDSLLRIGAAVRYSTSVAMKLELPTFDSSVRTAARAQRLDSMLQLGIRVAPGETSTSFLVGVGYGMRRLTTEGVTVLPDYTLSGVRLELGLRVPLFQGALVFGLVPEVELLLGIGSSLRDNGVSGIGYAAGGRAFIRVRATDRLRFELTYRESHASVDIVSDIERWITVSAIYVP